MKSNKTHTDIKTREDFLYSKNKSLDKSYDDFFKKQIKEKTYSKPICLDGFVDNKK